jgi:hypothetical protein
MRAGASPAGTSTKRCARSEQGPGTASRQPDIDDMLGEIERGYLAKTPE